MDAKPLENAENQWESGGFRVWPAMLDAAAQRAMLADIAAVAAAAPFYTPVMPRTGRPFSIRMTACGPLGWVSDRAGYRYQPKHPETGADWPEIPASVRAVWEGVAPGQPEPECCLVNWYGTEKSRMGLHQDRDEKDFSVPVVSISLGDPARFRLGGTERRGKTQSLMLNSGDVMVLSGESRLAFHGIDRVRFGATRLLADNGFPGGGRLNLTLRRVN